MSMEIIETIARELTKYSDYTFDQKIDLIQLLVTDGCYWKEWIDDSFYSILADLAIEKDTQNEFLFLSPKTAMYLYKFMKEFSKI